MNGPEGTVTQIDQIAKSFIDRLGPHNFKKGHG
jgi:hypothetical protein